MEMNMNRLRATMVLHGENMTTLAKALGMSRSTLSSKMNGHRYFTVGNILKISKHYALKPWEVEAIFFPKSGRHYEFAEVRSVPVFTMGEKINACTTV